MKSLAFEVPAMYGDHHVMEVRRILLEMEGVDSVNASSAFRVVEVHFDPDRASADAVRERLDEAGYLADLDVPRESGEPAVKRGVVDGPAFFRHSASHEAVGDVMSFGQETPFTGRPLWPCPGMSPAEKMDE